jgi:hypothetical protein
MKNLIKKMQEEARREKMEVIASIEHQRWSDWQSWLHKILRENLPSPELEKVLERWDRQIATEYSDLTESEKQSDRDQVERYLPVVDAIIAQTVTEARRQTLLDVLAGLPGDRELIDCGVCNACDVMMTCTTMEANRDHNTALQTVRAHIEGLLGKIE